MSRRVRSTVDRSDYDALQARYDKLLDAFIALKPASAPLREVETSTPQVPVDDVDRVRDVQRQMAIDAARADFMSQGMTELEAEREAERVIGSLFAPIMGDFQ